MWKEMIKRSTLSFSISAICGLIVNLAIDLIVNTAGGKTGFISMSPEFLAFFPTPVMAAYINVLLYGVIGAVFAGMTCIFECRKIGFVVQNLIYFAVTASVWVIITILVWQLHRYPQALISTIAGYGVTYIIVGIITYRRLKRDIAEINSALGDM